ncbi:hypothetical protein, partial [Xenorhabdus bovienii]|uniref:hypothetical protein n=1 Tax=Xenorhabdus bovienii TaxID=40576 RepID=UPI003DA3C174
PGPAGTAGRPQGKTGGGRVGGIRRCRYPTSAVHSGHCRAGGVGGIRGRQLPTSAGAGDCRPHCVGRAGTG